MKSKAFTLIEVMVVMAIISILAGMLMPSVWKFWESEEIATTKERMREIKKGLVGDKSLIQNGTRTHYGFVGDNGELPIFSNISTGELSFLVSKPTGVYPHWNGPYLTGLGSEWNRDAWGKEFRFRYSPISKDTHGRYISAELSSAGPDGVFGTSDDIVDPDIQVSDREVTPTNRVRIQGNIFSNYSNLGITIKFRDPIDPTGISTRTTCKKLTSAAGYSNYTTLFESGANPIKLPVGGIEVTTDLYYSVNSNCDTTKPKKTNTFLYFVSDNANQIILPELR